MTANNKPTFVYLTDPKSSRVITLAYTVHQKETIGMPLTTPEFVANVGYAVCHQADSHTKRIGRNIAVGRLAKTPLVLDLATNTAKRDRLVALVGGLTTDDQLDKGHHKFVRRAAKYFVQESLNREAMRF